MLLLISQTVFGNEQIVIAVSATPNNLNPLFSTDANSQNIGKLLHRSLVNFNSKMELVCDACESFAEKMLGKKHVVEFKLKEEIYFNDRTKVEAIDIKKSWEYFAKNKLINSVFMGTFENIEDLQIENKYNFKIIYKSYSLENISNLALLKIIKISSPKNQTINIEDIIGCGAYTIEKLDTLEVKLKPNNVEKPRLIFKVVKDETTLALKLINHEIDLSVANMSPRKTEWLVKQNKLLTVWQRPSGNYIFMGINHKKKKLNDIRVRQALSLLIPRKEILKFKLLNTAILSSGMFSPAFNEMFEEQIIDNYDPVKAEQLLIAAGYGKTNELTLDWIISNNKASIEIAEVIQHYLENAGIIVNLTVQEWGTYMHSYQAGKFDIVVAQWVGFNGPDMLNFVYNSKNTPPKGGNRTSYNNPEVDALLDQATTEMDNSKRTTLYKKASAVIRSDYGSINLWHPNIIWIGSSCLKNISLTPSGGFDALPQIIKDKKNCEK
jgi:peptide/nickel transport system substrate-binding protein